MPRLLLALLILVVALTAFAPPGLCPCWLFVEVEAFHPHAPDQAAHPHSHNYLFEVYQGQTAAVMPPALLPAALLLVLLSGLLRWRRLPHQDANGAGWNFPSDVPPPRPCRLMAAA